MPSVKLHQIVRTVFARHLARYDISSGIPVVVWQPFCLGNTGAKHQHG